MSFRFDLLLYDSQCCICEVPVGSITTYLGKIKFNYFGTNISSQITAVTSQYTDVENSDNALAGEPREGILGPIPGYKVCDLSMSYTRDRFEYVFGVNNLLNERYYTRRALGYPGPGILPSAPVNGFVNVKFTLEPKRSN